MNWKHKTLWLGSALLLGLGMAGPAMADEIGDLPVSVTVVEDGATMTAALASGSNANFANVEANAAGPSGTGVYDVDAVQFDVVYSNDTKLYRDGSDINIKLGDGTVANAYLNLTGGDPTFDGATLVDFQIPGRYLSISGMINPQQLKFTNVSGGSSAPIWSNDGSTARPPRVAGSETTGLAIYKVGDIGGSFGVGEFGSATCHVTTDNVIVAWPTSCGANDFGETGGASHQIAYILDGSGFVEATHTIELDLQVPAGVYPGTYTGTLTVEQTFS